MYSVVRKDTAYDNILPIVTQRGMTAHVRCIWHSTHAAWSSTSTEDWHPLWSQRLHDGDRSLDKVVRASCYSMQPSCTACARSKVQVESPCRCALATPQTGWRRHGRASMKNRAKLQGAMQPVLRRPPRKLRRTQRGDSAEAHPLRDGVLDVRSLLHDLRMHPAPVTVPCVAPNLNCWRAVAKHVGKQRMHQALRLRSAAAGSAGGHGSAEWETALGTAS